MKAQSISPAPGGGKVRSARSGSEPRIGATVEKPVQRTVHPFNPNPFKASGSQESADVGATNTGDTGPSIKTGKVNRTYKDVQGADGELGRKFGDAGKGSNVNPKR
jgi:hypothetical protein